MGLIKCSSCGASNQLPEGTSSMFCAYCGTSIQNVISGNTSSNTNTLAKSKIKDGYLAYRGRNIKSLYEIINLYSDSELEKIEELDLSDNLITSLEGIERFELRKLNLSNNNLESIDSLPIFSSESQYDSSRSGYYNYTYRIKLDFSNNIRLKNFSDNVILKLNELSNVDWFELNLKGCSNFNISQFLEIDFKKILIRSYYTSISVEKNNDSSDVFKRIGFEGNGGYWTYRPFDSNYVNSSELKKDVKNEYDFFKSISTSNWIQLLVPQFFAILFLIFAKNTSEEVDGIFSGLINLIYQFINIFFLPDGDITYLRCLVVANFYIVFLMIIILIPWEGQEKTGRSFRTKHATFDEYRTVTTDPYVPSSYIYFIILAFHILVIFMYFKFGNHVVSNVDIDNNNTAVDTSYVSPSSSPTTTYEENYSDTSYSTQYDTTNYEYNSVNENQNNYDDSSENSGNDEGYNTQIYNSKEVEIKPEFPGGISNFYKFLQDNINYPNEDLNGSVFISFVVEKDGTLGEFKIIKDIGYGAGDEVIRVLKKSPRWIPGEQKGVKVRTTYTLPINF